MRLTHLVCAGMLSVLVYGCGTAPAPPSPRPISPMAWTVPSTPCKNVGENNVDCVIDLNIRPDGGNSCKIDFAKPDDYLLSFEKGALDKFIYWRILTADYEFTEDDGVAFVDNFRPRGFAKGRRNPGDTKVYRWLNLNRKMDPRDSGRVYSYVINVETSSGATTARACTLDPWIRNRGD